MKNKKTVQLVLASFSVARRRYGINLRMAAGFSQGTVRFLSTKWSWIVLGHLGILIGQIKKVKVKGFIIFKNPHGCSWVNKKSSHEYTSADLLHVLVPRPVGRRLVKVYRYNSFIWRWDVTRCIYISCGIVSPSRQSVVATEASWQRHQTRHPPMQSHHPDTGPTSPVSLSDPLSAERINKGTGTPSNRGGGNGIISLTQETSSSLVNLYE